jgi:hypothetical protein
MSARPDKAPQHADMRSRRSEWGHAEFKRSRFNLCGNLGRCYFLPVRLEWWIEMNWRLGSPLAGVLLGVTTGLAAAHHSLAMFDQGHPIELVGVVREYNFSSPHAYILLEVKGPDGLPVIWRLEGNSPNSLTWDGWSHTTLRPGDEIRMTVEPLRSGAPGGSWSPKRATLKDGRPMMAAH